MKKRLSDAEVEERLDEIHDQLPEGVMMSLPAFKRRRANEQRRVAVRSDAWRDRENRRQLGEAERALARVRS